MVWLKITSARWAAELGRWLYPGTVVEVPAEQVPEWSYHTVLL